MAVIYSKDEDDFLKKNFRSMSFLEMSHSLNRTLNSIRNRCSKIGIVKKNEFWTDNQISLLKNAYQKAKCSKDINLDDLAKKIGKQKTGIRKPVGDRG